ncbi:MULTISPECIES: hypothetical protein, partial [unclassified Paenibacillus]|uniref:hypothetical protein n=1 Tax=unclassified Paenibacillus TaxID=185978 RepID=UPI0030F8FB00
IDPESSATHLSVCRFRMSIALAKCYRSPLDPLQLLLTLSWMRSIAQDLVTAGASIRSLQLLT